MISLRKDQQFTDTTDPKLTSDNFQDFNLDFQGTARRQVGLFEIIIDCLLLPNDVGNHDTVWNSREEIINNCEIFNGQYYKYDA